MFTPRKSTPTFKFDTSRVPGIVISATALAKMELFVDICKDEVGWLGTAELFHVEQDTYIELQDVFLIEQEVHATTTELTPEGLTNFGSEILSQPNGMETWNKMRMWGHSHVNMGTSPSGQDDIQMKDFKEIGHEWFVRLIANKKGDIRIDLFDYESGITMLDIPWEAEEVVSDAESVELEQRMQAIYAELDAIETQLEEKRKAHVAALRPVMQAEITAKVKTKSYATGFTRQIGGTNVGKHQSYSHQSYGSERFGSAYGTTYDPFDDGVEVGWQRGSTLTSTWLDGRSNKSQVFTDINELRAYFQTLDIMELARINTIPQLERFFFNNGFQATFTKSEAESMWKLAKRTYPKV